MQDPGTDVAHCRDSPRRRSCATLVADSADYTVSLTDPVGSGRAGLADVHQSATAFYDQLPDAFGGCPEHVHYRLTAYVPEPE